MIWGHFQKSQVFKIFLTTKLDDWQLEIPWWLWMYQGTISSEWLPPLCSARHSLTLAVHHKSSQQQQQQWQQQQQPQRGKNNIYDNDNNASDNDNDAHNSDNDS